MVRSLSYRPTTRNASRRICASLRGPRCAPRETERQSDRGRKRQSSARVVYPDRADYRFLALRTEIIVTRCRTKASRTRGCYRGNRKSFAFGTRAKCARVIPVVDAATDSDASGPLGAQVCLSVRYYYIRGFWHVFGTRSIPNSEDSRDTMGFF